MLFTARHTQERVYYDLQDRHPRTDHEPRNKRYAVSREQGKGERSQSAGHKRPDHHWLLAEPFHQETSGDGHHSVSDKEGERQKSRRRQAYVKTADDVRQNWTQNIGQQ